MPFCFFIPPIFFLIFRVVDVVGFDERDFIGCNVIDYFHPSDNAKLIPCLHLCKTPAACII